jgi:hypothetical protein
MKGGETETEAKQKRCVLISNNNNRMGRFAFLLVGHHRRRLFRFFFGAHAKGEEEAERRS